MEEIKEGDYVRTKEGKITKVINVEIENYKDGTTEVFIETELNPGYLDYTNKDILKHSKNIIDLIEVGDYVNGHKIEEKFYDYANKEYHLVTEGKKHIFVKDIKSIVTKEQFNSVSYEV